jgi:hypothetical protein
MKPTLNVTVDPKIHVGAYVSKLCADGTRELYCVLGPERDDDGVFTGRYEIENAKGEWSSYGNGTGVWIHKRVSLTAMEIADNCELARPALSLEHLDRQMDEHIRLTRADRGTPIISQTGLPQIRSYPRTLNPTDHP